MYTVILIMKEKKIYGQIWAIYSLIIFFIGLYSINLGYFTVEKFFEDCLLQAILAGVIEEVIFRKLILNKINEKKGTVKSIIYSSIIFSLMHLINLFNQPLLDTIIQIISSFAGGCLFGVIYSKQKNLINVIILHFLYDLGVFTINLIPLKDNIFTGILFSCILELIITSYLIYYAYEIYQKGNKHSMLFKIISVAFLVLMPIILLFQYII